MLQAKGLEVLPVSLPGLQILNACVGVKRLVAVVVHKQQHPRIF